MIDLLEKKEDIENEIETSSEFISEIHGGLAAIEDAVKKLHQKKSVVPVELSENVSHTNLNASNNT